MTVPLPSKRALRSLSQGENDAPLDERSTVFGALSAPDDPDAELIIQELFSGTEVPSRPEVVKAIIEFRAVARNEWTRAREAFLAIGRGLIELEGKLSKSAYDRLIKGADRLLPFGEAVACQLRVVARAVDSGRCSQP